MITTAEGPSQASRLDNQKAMGHYRESTSASDVRFMRRANDLSPVQCAKVFGVKAATWLRWERQADPIAKPRYWAMMAVIRELSFEVRGHWQPFLPVLVTPEGSGESSSK